MDFFGLNPSTILVIAVVAIIVFGPDKLPEFARTAGRYVREFRRMSQEVRTQVSRELTMEVTNEEGKKVGLEQYFVQIKSDVTGVISDVKQSIVTETSAVKSAFTIDPTALGAVTSDTITTTVISNPDSAQAETVFESVEPTNPSSALPASVSVAPQWEGAPRRRTRVHVLSVERPRTSGNSTNEPEEILKEGTSWSEYEQGLVMAGNDNNNNNITNGIGRKLRISKRGGYAGSRSKN